MHQNSHISPLSSCPELPVPSRWRRVGITLAFVLYVFFLGYFIGAGFAQSLQNLF